MESTNTVAEPVQLAQQLLAKRKDAPDIYKLPYGFEPQKAAIIAKFQEDVAATCEPVNHEIPAAGFCINEDGLLETLYGSTLSDQVFRKSLQSTDNLNGLSAATTPDSFWSLTPYNSIAVFTSTKIQPEQIYRSYYFLASAIVKQQKDISDNMPPLDDWLPEELFALPLTRVAGEFRVYKRKDGTIWKPSFSIDHSTPTATLTTFGKIERLKATSTPFSIMTNSDGNKVVMVPARETVYTPKGLRAYKEEVMLACLAPDQF